MPLTGALPDPPTLANVASGVQDGVSTTLDGLRAGDAGERIPRDSVASSSLFTNDFLP